MITEHLGELSYTKKQFIKESQWKHNKTLIKKTFGLKQVGPTVQNYNIVVVVDVEQCLFVELTLF